MGRWLKATLIIEFIKAGNQDVRVRGAAGKGRGGEGRWEETEGEIIGKEKEQRRGKWKNYANCPGTEKGKKKVFQGSGFPEERVNGFLETAED